MLKVLSLGAGVQSSTLALMIANGEVEPVDAAIFADTGSEPRSVYTWLDWLEPLLPFPVHRVQWKDGLETNIKKSIEGGRFAGAPFYTRNKIEEEGRLRRQCTREFKVQPITRKVRELVGLAPGQRAPREVMAVQFIGISWDEVQRMKPSRDHWIEHRWPLIDRRMTRGHCIEWMLRNGYPEPPRSACYFCPYKSNEEWKRLRDSEPEEWKKAIAMDELIRGGVRGTVQPLYLHRSLQPLKDVDLRSAEDAGQLSMFGNECEGMCGV